MPPFQFGHRTCSCDVKVHVPKLVALTGGPGGGKTAVLEIAERIFCKHVAVVPEAASIIFGGGFPRHESVQGQRASQRAIYHVQRQLERLMLEEDEVAIILCDRGTLDGAAYWPGDTAEFWSSVDTTREAELARYDAVIHLETPDDNHGYNRENVLRIESALTARAIDERIAEAWASHPQRFVVPSSERFLDKAQLAISFMGDLLPPCCG